MMSNFCTRVDEVLQHLGIPIVGVSLNRWGNPVIDFKPEATAAQRQMADTALADIMAGPKQERTVAELVPEVAALAAAERAKLNAIVAADYLASHPRVAREFGIALYK